MRISLRSLTLTIHYMIFGATIALSAFLVLTNSSQAHAVSSYSITMTPSSTELHAAPGATTKSNFTVVNQGSTSYPVALSVMPYHVLGDSYDPQFKTLAGTTDPSSWIHFDDSTTQTLLAGTTQTLSYNLTVPSGTAPGGYYAVIFAETNPSNVSGGVTAHNRVGNILYITVDGAVTQKGTLTAPLSDISSIIWGDSTHLGMLVNDTGGLHFLTTANINVSSVFGKTQFAAQLQRYVLPQTERLITTTWNNLPLIGIYKITRNATVAGTIQNLPVKYIVIIRPWVLAVILLIITTIATLGLVIRYRKSTSRLTKGKGKPDVRN